MITLIRRSPSTDTAPTRETALECAPGLVVTCRHSDPPVITEIRASDAAGTTARESLAALGGRWDDPDAGFDDSAASRTLAELAVLLHRLTGRHGHRGRARTALNAALRIDHLVDLSVLDGELWIDMQCALLEFAAPLIEAVLRSSERHEPWAAGVPALVEFAYSELEPLVPAWAVFRELLQDLPSDTDTWGEFDFADFEEPPTEQWRVEELVVRGSRPGPAAPETGPVVELEFPIDFDRLPNRIPDCDVERPVHVTYRPDTARLDVAVDLAPTVNKYDDLLAEVRIGDALLALVHLNLNGPQANGWTHVVVPNIDDMVIVVTNELELDRSYNADTFRHNTAHDD